MTFQRSAIEARDRATAIALLVERVRSTADQVKDGLPHWAAAANGHWTTTPDGDWTGGAWIGMLWCAARLTGEEWFRDRAGSDLERLRPRLSLCSAFRGFPFYYGAALGDILFSDDKARVLGLACAESLLSMFSPAMGLIPLGADAEEGSEIGGSISSIDSLQAVPLLYWAFRKNGDRRYLDAARSHARRVLAIHQRQDGSIVQSSELDPKTGAVLRHFTHKGYSDTSVWGRAQAWGMLYAALAEEWDDEPAEWRDWGMQSANWWMAHLPKGGIAPWDFDDPKAPNRLPDTAATAIASVALLKLAAATSDEAFAARCRGCALRSIDAMIRAHLTPLFPGDGRPRGMLVDACFNNRPDSRPQDAATSAEFIVGSAFLFQALMFVEGRFGIADF